jgi:hypothetical protein
LKFESEFNQKIALVLNNLNEKFLADCQAYLGGGTLVNLKHGEHRLSRDIDLVCSIGEGYRLLRTEVGETGYNALFKSFERLVLPKAIQADQYGIRFPIIIDGITIKLEIVAEARIKIDSPDYLDWLPIPCLSKTDVFAEKLLANADRWLDSSKKSRDLIDLAIMRLSSPIPPIAIDKAEKAYPVINPLTRAIQQFQDNPDYREQCYTSLQIKSPRLVIDGIDLLATDFGLKATTTRIFSEQNWDYLEDDY